MKLQHTSIFSISIKGVVTIVLYIPILAIAMYPLMGSTNSKDFNKDDYIKKGEMANYVESISPDDPQAEPIRNLQAQEKGPWGKQGKLPKAEILIVTVPGYVEKGKANACEEHHGNKYILRSDTYEGKSTIVHANAYIMPAGNCADTFTYDMQISCEDAKLIFTSKMLSCDEDGNPKWKNEAPANRRLELYAVPIIDAL